jgi:predicted anti-sigma-YlaC factor YlaD
MKSPKKSLKKRIHGAIFKLPLMITCNEFESFILAYLEGDLPKRQKVVFEFHLKMCRECREYLQAYRASIELAREAHEAELKELTDQVPEDLVKAILAARKA